jgi:hypothetical protein
MTRIKYILPTCLILLLFITGCNKFDPPGFSAPTEMQATMTIKELKGLYMGGGTLIEDKDAVIRGTVISTDKYGNFYRSIYIQDETTGIEVKIGKTALYNNYKIGQIVYVKVYRLSLGQYGGLLQLGYTSTDPRYETSYLDADLIIHNSVFAGAMSATPVVPAEITLGTDITEDRMSSLVTIKNAVYKSGTYRLNNITYPLTAWAKKDDPETSADDSAYGEHIFALSDNTEIVVRTSGYSRFAETEIPFSAGDRGDITGVLTRFNTTYQLILNNDIDAVKLTP